MKIATWNVNSLRVRLPQVLTWLEQHSPDIFCLQETKVVDEDFPEQAIFDCGYEVIYSGQKTYNGVAIISKAPAMDIATDLPRQNDPQRRVLAATIDRLRVVNVYVPNGQFVDSDKYQYKLSWLRSLQRLVECELARTRNLVLVGDFNIAPESIDVHDADLWRGKVLCSEPERAALRNIMQVGLNDSFRKFEQEPDSYSWWDYRAGAFPRNRGLRIDHILCSTLLYGRCRSCVIDKDPRKLEQPSDHAPVVAEFEY